MFKSIRGCQLLLRVCLALPALAVVALMQPAALATPVTFVTVPGSDSDGPLAASITFTPLNGQIQVTVTNTETGTFAKGQAISDFTFLIIGSTPSAFTDLSGVKVNSASIGAGGSWTLASGTSFHDIGPAPIDHWGASLGSTNSLATAGAPAPGGNPVFMILPSSGTAGPGSSLADSHFDPYIIGPATFLLTDAGVTSSTNLAAAISGVTVSFGTGPDKVLSTTVLTPTPEPNAIFLLGVGLASFFGIGFFRK